MMLEFYIPRETIIYRPEVAVPLIGHADCQYDPTKQENVYSVEIWEDDGDDGHTQYVLKQTVKMNKEQFDNYLRQTEFILMT